MDWMAWSQMFFNFMLGMETVWVAIISGLLGYWVAGNNTKKILASTERMAAAQLKSEEDRWYSQKFLEHKADALAELAAQITRVSDRVYRLPDGIEDLSTCLPPFFAALLGASAYLDREEANRIGDCGDMVRTIISRYEELRPSLDKKDPAATTEMNSLAREKSSRVFGLATSIINFHLVPRLLRKENES